MKIYSLKRKTLVLMFFILAGILLFSTKSFAGTRKKPRLSKNKITLEVGKPKTVKVKNAKKVTWKILSGKKYIRCKKRKKSIRVTGKAAGTAKILAKAGRKKLKLTVKVKKVKKKQDPTPSDTPVTETVDPVSAGIGDFTFSLLRDLHQGGAKNPFISPDSILSALSMTAAGARGETLSQMNKAMKTKDNKELADYLLNLHQGLSQSQTVKYKVADSIWTNQGLITVKEDFIKTNKEKFGAQVYSVPFNDAALASMNDWVAKNTDQMIPFIINQLSPDDRMILLNAICFEGRWAEPYDDSQVKKDSFTLKDGSKKTVKMLQGGSQGKYYLELAKGRGFIKYYADSRFAFFAFLPPEGESVDTWLAKIDGAGFRKACEHAKERIILSKIPVFSLDYDVSLKKTLTRMGMELAFTDIADFSGISDQRILIDDVIHKTHIELDKNGTKAAAATAVIAKASSAPHPSVAKEEIYLNRPFVYGIMDTGTKTPLFAGVIDQVGE